MSEGYAADTIEIALGTAKPLVATGSVADAEDPGRHPNLLRARCNSTFGALDGGAEPGVARTRAERTGLRIRVAGGTPGKRATAIRAAVPVSALPTFAAHGT